ncbi:hypothetical protein CC86DRAFT_468651 [Ophiobolus disseminans]|uniref:Kinase-like protein n=1 Tax=Ophiobolus disseminans TaxID=1469910 RepID=A0A6A6ZVR8_9PLEO|nr:hypothetical protein CC86DRAFT_468651 [Ophiobolus disseminans]
MDPLSITAACVSLTASISKTSISVTTFVRAVRAARGDLDAVSRELASLTTLLELLAEDAKDINNFPETLRKHITGILANCELVLIEVQRVIAKYDKPGVVTGSKWVLAGSEDVAKLQLSLEAHKSALEIALEMVMLSMTKEIKHDTTHILDDTAAIKNDTSEILQEIARLRAQLPDDQATLRQSTKDSDSTLARYLDDLSSYAETVCWSGEDSDTDVEQDEVKPPQKLKSANPTKFVPSLPPIPKNSPRLARDPDTFRSSRGPIAQIQAEENGSVVNSGMRPVLSSTQTAPSNFIPSISTVAVGELRSPDALPRPATAPPEPHVLNKQQLSNAPTASRNADAPNIARLRPNHGYDVQEDRGRELEHLQCYGDEIDATSSGGPMAGRRHGFAQSSEQQDTLKAPKHQRSRSLSKDGITQRVMEKLQQQYTATPAAKIDLGKLASAPRGNPGHMALTRSAEGISSTLNPVDTRTSPQHHKPDTIQPNVSSVSVVPATLFTVKALYDFTGSDVGDRSFEKGQILHVTKEYSGSSWYSGHLNGGTECGAFPANYVKRFELGNTPNKIDMKGGEQQQRRVRKLEVRSGSTVSNATMNQPATLSQLHVQGGEQQQRRMRQLEGQSGDMMSNVAMHQPTTFTQPNVNLQILDHHWTGQHLRRITAGTTPGAWSFWGYLEHTSKANLELRRHSKSNEIAVIKSYPRTAKDSNDYKVRIFREAEVLGLLNHPHIIRLHYFASISDSWLLYLEDAGSTTLSQYVSQHGRTSADAQYSETWNVANWDRKVRQFARQIGSALRYCQANCVHHCSLSADKVIVDEAGSVKLTGFGSLQLYSNFDEQRFDTFCYGTVLWHMVCGSAPWPASENWDRYSQRAEFGALTQPEDISYECFSLLSGLVGIAGDAAPKLSLKKAIDHPWLDARRLGFGASVPDYIPRREPLPTPISASTIQKLSLFDFSPPEHLQKILADILASPNYQDSVNVWTYNALQAGTISGGFRKNWKAGVKHGDAVTRAKSPKWQGPAPEFDSLDFWELLRSRIASPPLSMYYLAMEKEEKEKREKAILNSDKFTKISSGV